MKLLSYFGVVNILYEHWVVGTYCTVVHSYLFVSKRKPQREISNEHELTKCTRTAFRSLVILYPIYSPVPLTLKRIWKRSLSDSSKFILPGKGFCKISCHSVLCGLDRINSCSSTNSSRWHDEIWMRNASWSPKSQKYLKVVEIFLYTHAIVRYYEITQFIKYICVIEA